MPSVPPRTNFVRRDGGEGSGGRTQGRLAERPCSLKKTGRGFHVGFRAPVFARNQLLNEISQQLGRINKERVHSFLPGHMVCSFYLSCGNLYSGVDETHAIALIIEFQNRIERHPTTFFARIFIRRQCDTHKNSNLAHGDNSAFCVPREEVNVIYAYICRKKGIYRTG